jgi:hypothetical protein
MIRYAPLLLVMLFVGCSSTGSQPGPGLTPADLVDRGVDMFGVVAEIPHRQYLGESPGSGTGRPTVFRWVAEHTLIDRGSGDVLMAVQDLQHAGLPVLDQGSQLDFVGGLYEDVRYRLAGTLNRISISQHYDVRLTVEWQLYDRDAGSIVFTGSSDGFARGQSLGRTGIQPNALLDSFQNCLRNLVGQPEFAKVISAAGVPG